MPLARLAAALACTAVLGSAGCARPREPIVLVCVDTLRSDRLPAYGYRGVETPHLDAFARDAVVYERAFSHVPLTLPSHVALFSGRIPPAAGVRNNRGYAVPHDVPLLAEALRERGYRTGGFVSSLVLDAKTGVGRGFDTYDDDIAPAPGADVDPTSFARRPGGDTLTRARAWLAGVGEAPFFLFFHIYEPHAPWQAPEPHASRWKDPYDALVAASDEILGALLEDLKRRGLYDRALVVFLSDHGEGLGDHGERQHGLFLYREALHVPLLVKLPGARGTAQRDARPVGLDDVGISLARFAGATLAGATGRAVFGPDADAGAPRVLYAETLAPSEGYGLAPLFAAIDWPRQLIVAPRPELYDLARDPAQRDELLRGGAPPADLVAALDAAGSGRFERASGWDEDEERLASLGYVGGARYDGTGADPKDAVPAIERLWSALERAGRGEAGPALDAEIVAAVEALSGAGVRSEVLTRTAARRLLRAERREAAAVLARRLRGGEQALSFVVAGEIAAARGESAQARADFERALAVDDGSARAHLGLGLLALAAGADALAAPALRRALALDPALADAHNAAGVFAARAGDVEGAVAAWERATALDPRLANAWFNLALAREKQGDRHGAAAALRRFAALAGPKDRAAAEARARDLAR